MEFDQAAQLYHERMQTDERFQLAYGVASRIMRGERWLLGGAVFRPIVKMMYDRPQPETDFDFVCDAVDTSVQLPEGYAISSNSHGNPKIVNCSLEIDCVPFKDWADRDNTIFGILSHSPTTVQSIAYNPVTGEIIGAGKIAISRQEIMVHELEELLGAARSKGMLPHEYLNRFSALGFKLVPGYISQGRAFPNYVEDLC
jgi:hypothetical protein